MEAPVKGSYWMYLERIDGERASDPLLIDFDNIAGDVTLIAKEAGCLRIAFSDAKDGPTLWTVDIDQPFSWGDAFRGRPNPPQSS
jgi:hypothetical protein